jgi:GNAT superfamily N-acetyltransferase
MHFVDLEPGDPRLETDLLPVLRQLREHLTPESFDVIYREGHPQGLRFTAVYDEDRCVAVAGWRMVATTFAGRKLYVDDLVTSGSERSRGFGKALLAELARRAEAAGASIIDLDSGVHRPDAHRFYFREGMQIAAFHFVRTLGERQDG